MRAIGWLLLGVGAAWLFRALSIDTSVAVPGGWGRVQNLSLMEQRRTHLMLSGGTIIVGVLLIGFSQLRRTGEDDDADYRQCPFCAESVRIEAVICRHCRSELPAVALADPDYPVVGADENVDAVPDEDTRTYSYRALREAVEAAERKQG